jgi:biopolymer transport protein ExbB
MMAFMTKLRLTALPFVAAIPFVWHGVGFAETIPQPVVDQAIQSPAPPVAAIPGLPASGVLGLLPVDLSPWGMFLHADIVVKAVICGLALASIATWTIWLAKSLELAVAKRRLRRTYRSLREARSLALAEERLSAGSGAADALVRAAREEWRASANALDDRDGLKERIALHLERIEAAAGRRMMIGTGILATIGSTAPFVGLFGTVWGIMNSFIGISKMHTTNLAVVAPGIAEALLATAIGLIAAIPAVVIYNHFARQIAGYKALVADAASAVMRLVSRDLSHGVRDEVTTLTLPKAAE